MGHTPADIPKPPESKLQETRALILRDSHNAHNKRAGSKLDLTDAAISQPNLEERSKDAPSIILPHQDAEMVSHIAIDIGGSLIKLVYFLPEDASEGDADSKPVARHTGGKLHFVKFETAKIGQAMDFIKANCLHMFRNGSTGEREVVRIKATGGGAYKFSDIFQERLGVLLEKEDEMDCAVAGCNFLLKAVSQEAFTYEDGQANFSNGEQTLFPYLLVNIGSGVSMIKVDGDGSFERVSGSSLGGGTFWGLCRLLTGCKNFDEMLELSARGDNSKVDMLVGDIYGDRDYTAIGLSASTIASSFGRVVSADLDLPGLEPADMAMALCRMVSYNIAHLSYLNAKRYDLPRIFFGGFFIRGHSYTMDTISFAIKFWSKREMSAKFLRHEGYLGAMGAFLKVHPMAPSVPETNDTAQRKVRARFVERFSMGGSSEAGNPSLMGLEDKVSWVEKFVRVGASTTEAAQDEHSRLQQQEADMSASESYESLQPSTSATNLDLHVGVLHYQPNCEPFPLLSQPERYAPDTSDLTDRTELEYWLNVLAGQIPTVVEKAIATDGATDDAKRRAAAFRRSFTAQLNQLRTEAGAYGKLGIGELFEMREECLREFGFTDVYRLDKERENAAALEVFPDLIRELDEMDPPARLASLIQGVLAANIFDWGARACVDLYHQGTILQIYREARTKLSKRPWRVDQFDGFANAWLEGRGENGSPLEQRGEGRSPFRRIIMFVDNAGADIVLGMMPLAREFLRAGAEVVLTANTQPAINDITAHELKDLIDHISGMCPIIKAARSAALAARDLTGGGVPPFPGLRRRVPSIPQHLSDLAHSSPDDHANPALGRSPARSFRSGSSGAASRAGCSDDDVSEAGQSPPGICLGPTTTSSAQHSTSSFAAADSLKRTARLYVVPNGQSSPCLDLRRVPASLADATVGTDLVILEGMGRAIHTNLRATFRCPVLKLAMIKTLHLAERLFGGSVYDCVCTYEPAPGQGGLPL